MTSTMAFDNGFNDGVNVERKNDDSTDGTTDDKTGTNSGNNCVDDETMAVILKVALSSIMTITLTTMRITTIT